MVAVGMILMFTLPFSKGQYFDFNPYPLAALVAASVSIPFILGNCLFVAARISYLSTNNRIPFILTSIIAVIMTIQSTTTITSNSYFAWLFPFLSFEYNSSYGCRYLDIPKFKEKEGVVKDR